MLLDKLTDLIDDTFGHGPMDTIDDAVYAASIAVAKAPHAASEALERHAPRLHTALGLTVFAALYPLRAIGHEDLRSVLVDVFGETLEERADVEAARNELPAEKARLADELAGGKAHAVDAFVASLHDQEDVMLLIEEEHHNPDPEAAARAMQDIVRGARKPDVAGIPAF